MSNPPQQQPATAAQQQQLRLMQQRLNSQSPAPNGLPNQQAPFNLAMPPAAAATTAGAANPLGVAAAPARAGGPAGSPFTSEQLNHMIKLAKNGQLQQAQVEQLQKVMQSYQNKPAGATVPGGVRPPPVPAQQQGQGQQPIMQQGAGVPGQQRPRPPPAASAVQSHQMITALQNLAALTDTDRAAAIAKNPQLGVLYERWQATRRAQQAAGTAAGGNVAGGVPGGAAVGQQQANVRPPGTFGGAPVPNLQLPPNRVRNPNAPTNVSAPGVPGQGNMQQMRPNMPNQGRPPVNQAQFQNQQQQRVNSPAVGMQGQGQAGAGSAGGTDANGNPVRPNMNAGPGQVNRTNSPLTVPQSQTGPSPHPNPAGPRPTLSTGLPAGPMMGTPSLVQRQGQGWDEASRAGVQAKSDLGTIEGRKRKIREVLEDVEKGEKLEDGVEDILLEVIDELIDSSTQFAARLAKHRGSNTVDVRDFQLHFERNHNIRIPGLGSDEISQVQSQASRRHPALSQHAQRLAAVAAARAAHQSGSSITAAGPK